MDLNKIHTQDVTVRDDEIIIRLPPVEVLSVQLNHLEVFDLRTGVLNLYQADFSVLVDYETIENKKYSFSAGQYFPIKINKIEMNNEEFNEYVDIFKKKIDEYYNNEKQLREDLITSLEKVKYVNN